MSSYKILYPQPIEVNGKKYYPKSIEICRLLEFENFYRLEVKAVKKRKINETEYKYIYDDFSDIPKSDECAWIQAIQYYYEALAAHDVKAVKNKSPYKEQYAEMIKKIKENQQHEDTIFIPDYFNHP